MRRARRLVEFHESPMASRVLGNAFIGSLRRWMNRGWAAKLRKIQGEQVGCRLRRGVQHCTLAPCRARLPTKSRKSEKVETAWAGLKKWLLRVIFTSAEKQTPLRG